MSRRSYHDIGAAMAYGQACAIIETFDCEQLDAFPLSNEMMQVWRGIHSAALLEMLDIGAERIALSLGDCGDSDARCAASEPVSVR